MLEYTLEDGLAKVHREYTDKVKEYLITNVSGLNLNVFVENYGLVMKLADHENYAKFL
jgi:hypothetical protein